MKRRKVVEKKGKRSSRIGFKYRHTKTQSQDKKKKGKERPLVFLQAQIFVGPRESTEGAGAYCINGRPHHFVFLACMCLLLNMYGAEHPPGSSVLFVFSPRLPQNWHCAKRVRPRLVDGKTKKSPPTIFTSSTSTEASTGSTQNRQYLLSEAVVLPLVSHDSVDREV
ncbi:hypothetical protein B9Z55_019989 [Caenorhabditis nigoni]|uniref:Uncharacterized protein n=1 Tax=Caenorhabditis nigoni TaxID=1611254 RepID=A0A2G5TKW8_9PELO|nr:hypothetical protein B9Z55_019989 [Caenorhabditis nigoni]